MAPFHDGKRLKIPQAEFELVPQRYEDELHVLSFSWPDTWYAVLLFLRPDWSPHSWYVNLEEPLRRTAIGFDTLDHELDVIVELDGSWRWKDEDDLAEAIRRGVIPAEDEPRTARRRRARGPQDPRPRAAVRPRLDDVAPRPLVAGPGPARGLGPRLT